MNVFVFLCASLAVTQGSTSPLSIREGSLPGHSQNSLLQASCIQDSCMSSVFWYCSSIMQEIWEMKDQLQAVKEVIEDARQELKGLRETIISRQECEVGWSNYLLSCYKLFKTPVTYGRAAINCRTHDAYLASIGSEGENNFVASLLEGLTYIGLSDEDQEGVFIWQDGSPFIYSKWWRYDQPDNHNGNEDCVHMDTESVWDDIFCGIKRQYVCEKSLH